MTSGADDPSALGLFFKLPVRHFINMFRSFVVYPE